MFTATPDIHNLVWQVWYRETYFRTTIKGCKPATVGSKSERYSETTEADLLAIRLQKNHSWHIWRPCTCLIIEWTGNYMNSADVMYRRSQASLVTSKRIRMIIIIFFYQPKSLYIYICICNIYIYTTYAYIYIYIFSCMHRHIRNKLYVITYIHTYIHIYICVDMCTYTRNKYTHC